MQGNEKIRVALVDDSSVIRGALTRIIKTDPEIEIVASVANGEMAISTARTKQPDVMILDVEMPVMDGLTALPEILKTSPKTKVVMCSSLTAKGADTTLKAMTLGAVECLVKPSSAQESGPNSLFHTTLINLVRTLGGKQPASQTAMSAPQATSQQAKPGKTAPPAFAGEKNIRLLNDPMAYKGKPSVLAIGSSTGGPQALFQVLKDLGQLDIPVVITQHMPGTFTKILASHINLQTGLTAFEGADGMRVEAGKVYVAPGGKHMLFEKSGADLIIKLNDGPAENFCKPAVDPMLRSLVSIYGSRVLCTILTGMGQDGLEGARVLVKEKGRLIAQDEKTSVVWGMPGAVASDGICSAVLPLSEIGPWLKRACLK